MKEAIAGQELSGEKAISRLGRRFWLPVHHREG